ncbi:hypothetical protein KIL84_004412 [Mauremys mutica]|uniref:Uncharacterized protein n=1 Tax=Mauremys mutica TaxID=74926 RepID=A0A9D3XPM2_9SAUR|nr:hypothetical protein KIL84_004412 [Mauremys mutica]
MEGLFSGSAGQAPSITSSLYQLHEGARTPHAWIIGPDPVKRTQQSLLPASRVSTTLSSTRNDICFQERLGKTNFSVPQYRFPGRGYPGCDTITHRACVIKDHPVTQKGDFLGVLLCKANETLKA